MIIPLLGLLLGIFLGLLSPITIPIQYSTYMSIAILAALDSVFGGVRSSLENSLTLKFLYLVFANAVLAAILTYIVISWEFQFTMLQYLLLA